MAHVGRQQTARSQSHRDEPLIGPAVEGQAKTTTLILWRKESHCGLLCAFAPVANLPR